MADSTLPPDFNKQCQECHQIINGPAEGQNPGHKVQHISASGEYMQAEPDETHPFNVSHGLCEECGPRWMERMRQDYERMRSERAEREAQERQERQEQRRRERRFRRGRKDGQ